jgi:hypothetical protein
VIPSLYVPEWKTDMKNRKLIVKVYGICSNFIFIVLLQLFIKKIADLENECEQSISLDFAGLKKKCPQTGICTTSTH